MTFETKPYSSSYSAYFPPGFEALYEQMGFAKRWPHFTFAELACKGTGSLRVHYDTMDALERLRNMVGPIPITSYYRSPWHNERVGGARNSYHLLGKAVDTTVLNGNIAGRLKLCHLATLAGFKGFGVYAKFTHIDTGPTRFWQDEDAPLVHSQQIFDSNGNPAL